MTPRRALVVQSRRPLKVPMGHTSGALAPRNSAGCVRRRLYAIFLFTFDWRGSDPTPVGCLSRQYPRFAGSWFTWVVFDEIFTNGVKSEKL